MREGEEAWSDMARAFALLAVRNTFLEELHAGVPLDTVAGDYSDVKVITPTQEIPWAEISRFNDIEMKRLMEHVVDKLFTCFRIMFDGQRHEEFEYLMNLALRRAVGWNPAKPDEILENIISNRKKYQ